MSTREIEILIRKFYEGETTLAEEQILKNYFRGDGVPDELALHKPLFAFLEEELKEEIVNPDFDRNFFSGLTGEKGEVITMVPRRTRIVYFASMAAAFLLLAGIAVTLVMTVNSRPEFTRQERMDYAQAQEALMIVSSNLNCGVSHVTYLRAFDKGMEQMQLLSKFYEYQSIIINPEEEQTLPDKTNKQP
jgi:hypothetical protein